MMRWLQTTLTVALVHCNVVARPTVNAGVSCFGANPDFDSSCAVFNTQAACIQQVACSWGSPPLGECRAKDADARIEALCMKFSNATQCGAQVGCLWQSPADKRKLMSALTTSVTALKVDSSAADLPGSLRFIGEPTFSSAHDYKQVAVADLDAMLNAWAEKFGLPRSVISDLRVLVAAESTEYKQYHVEVASQGVLGIEEVAAAGRNSDGTIELALVHAQASRQVGRYLGWTCKEHTNDNNNKVKKKCGPIKGQKKNEAPWLHSLIRPCWSSSDCDVVPISEIPGGALQADEMEAVTAQLQTFLGTKLLAESLLLKVEILPSEQAAFPAFVFV